MLKLCGKLLLIVVLKNMPETVFWDEAWVKSVAGGVVIGSGGRMAFLRG